MSYLQFLYPDELMDKYANFVIYNECKCCFNFAAVLPVDLVARDA
jgi:hypothetical protein